MDLSVAAPGIARFGDTTLRCAIGRGGLSAAKIEGDGTTPTGGFFCRWLYWRADRLLEPATGLGRRPLSPADGWCDDPKAARYNRFVRLPCPERAENLWREDGVYDIIVVLGYNDLSTVSSRGSAIFLHVARVGFPPTEGCVALERDCLLRFIGAAGPGSRVIIG